MTQSFANYSSALKENYAPGLRNAINNSNVVWASAVKDTERILGSEAVWSIHSGRSGATGNRAESAALPTEDRQRLSKARKDLVYMYHTIKITGPARHLTKGNEGAFIEAVNLEVKHAEKDLKNDLSRQVFGQVLTVNSTSQTGLIATLSADPGTGTTFAVANEDDSVIRHFHVNMKVDIVNPATGALRTGSPYTITAVQRVAKTFTVSAAIDAGVASGDFVARSGNLNEEIDGLRHLLGTASYAGIDPSVAGNDFWQAMQVGSPSTAISEVILDEAAETIMTDGDGGEANIWVAEHVQRRKLASQLQVQKRYEGRETEITAGWKGLQLSHGVLMVDRYCPTSYCFGLNTSELTKFIGLDFQWDEDDSGGVFFKALDGSDATQARFKGYHNLATTNRNSHALLRLAEPTF